MTNLALEQLYRAELTVIPSNHQLVDSDYEDTEVLEDTPYEYREDFMSAMESGVWL